MRYTVQSAYGGRVVSARAAARLRGLGQDSVEERLAIGAPTIVGGVLTGVASTGGIWGMSAAVAVPVIGAVVAGVTIGLMALFSRKGPKQKVATTQIVDKVEPLLQENLAGYMAGPRTRTSQTQALENFKAGWQYVVDNCDVPIMGDPGQRCVSDRNRGGQWDWWSYYYDPIANDPDVKPDPVPGGGVDAIFGDGNGGINLPPSVAGIPTGLLLAGAALTLFLTMGGSK